MFKYTKNQCLSLCLLVFVLVDTFALPQHPVYQHQQIDVVQDSRKFAEKPNNLKKVPSEDLDDVSTNAIQESNEPEFSWPFLINWLMQTFLGPTKGVSPSKNDVDDVPPASPWTNLITVGLRILTAFLGGNQPQSDGIDKVDNQSSSPMQQFINIVMNLLDALKTSFSHRSLQARSLGKKDSVSDAAVASISMLKGYVRSMKSYSNYGRADEEGQRGCAERALCEANAECTTDSEGTSSIFCQLGSYATSYLLQRQSGVNFEALYEAGRRGRSGEDCRTLFLDCNVV